MHKICGSRFLEGEHGSHITEDGPAVFPRIEALFAKPSRLDPPPRARLSSGLASLDAMFGGGLPAATITALVGPSGAGKTTIGLHLLSASNVDGPGLLFGCYESPETLRLTAETMGFELAGAEQRGDVAVLWHPTGEYILDELAHRLLDAVRRRGGRRLLIDGVSGFQRAALEPERIVRFWSALSHELRALGVTTMHTLEMPTLTGVDIRPPGSDISSLAGGHDPAAPRRAALAALSGHLIVQGARGRVRPDDSRVLDHRPRRRQTIRECPGRSGQRST